MRTVTQVAVLARRSSSHLAGNKNGFPDAMFRVVPVFLLVLVNDPSSTPVCEYGLLVSLGEMWGFITFGAPTTYLSRG